MSYGDISYGLQKQVSVMSMNLSAKLDDLQRGDRHLETTVALCEIRTQLQELTKSVESCQSEVSEVKRDMVQIKHELDTVQQVKEEIEELREYVDRLEEHTHRRKLRLLEQGLTFFLTYAIFAAVLGMLQFGYNTGVINAPEVNIENFMKDVYKDRYGEDISEEFIQQLYSVAVSIFAIGGMLGGFSGGWMANRFGRKGGLLMNNVLGITGACLMGFTKMSHSYEILFLGRFIIGVNCALRRLRASNQVEEDIEEMRAEERAQQSESSISTIELICSPTLRAPLMIGIVMQLSQQFSGINAVFYYSTSLFMSSGLTEESAKFATIGIGAIMQLIPSRGTSGNQCHCPNPGIVWRCFPPNFVRNAFIVMVFFGTNQNGDSCEKFPVAAQRSLGRNVNLWFHILGGQVPHRTKVIMSLVTHAERKLKGEHVPECQ
ncbi:glucose transporter [Culex quinquefasciatus]|uniref:Glucose transporter n=1 Tax=Culex quinquefasciatus TaxID=7176 RepID=B0WEH3_CULQU|nr:glucose transporter [Culex quinquefasciatus]|eukprot:XP_001847107.1 glucose transporter [Culex quinquefasciatus]